MDFGTLLFFGFLWFLFNLLKGAGKTVPGKLPPARTPGTPPSQPRPNARPLPVPSGTDPTQQEGGRLEGLLRDLHRTLDEAARAKERASASRQPQGTRPGPATPAPDATSEAFSLETDVSRPTRTRVDQDDAAEQVVARRIAAAEARNVGHTATNHRDFDRRIRPEPADHTAVAPTYSPTPTQLRDAMVWREILGPPAALRDREPPAG